MEKPSHPLLDSLEKDLAFYNDAIKEVANEILDKKLSKYPVFIAHELEVSVGEVILDKNDYGRKWTINASILEELVESRIIQEDKQDEFKKIYKDPRKFICVFLISEKGGNFIFYPYQNKPGLDLSLEEQRN